MQTARGPCREVRCGPQHVRLLTFSWFSSLRLRSAVWRGHRAQARSDACRGPALSEQLHGSTAPLRAHLNPHSSANVDRPQIQIQERPKRFLAVRATNPTQPHSLTTFRKTLIDELTIGASPNHKNDTALL
jgi:hypothetical protein